VLNSLIYGLRDLIQTSDLFDHTAQHAARLFHHLESIQRTTHVCRSSSTTSRMYEICRTITSDEVQRQVDCWLDLLLLLWITTASHQSKPPTDSMITIAMIRRSVSFMAIVMSFDSSSAFSSVKIQQGHRLIYLTQHLPTSLISINRHRPFSLFLKDDDKPDYENIHGPLGKMIDDMFLTEFRIKMAEKV
jgi:hypothetical protein